MSDPQTCCLCLPKSGPTVLCTHPYTLALEQSRKRLRTVTNQSLHVSQPTQDLRQIPNVDIVPEFSFFQDLIIHKRDFWYWACKFLNCIQLIILFVLFTKRLQNRRNQFWGVCVLQRCLHLRVHPVSFPNFLCMLLKVALQGYFVLQLFAKKLVVFRTYSLDSDRIF